MDTKLKQKLNDVIRQDNQSKMYMCEHNMEEVTKNYNMGLLTEHEVTGQMINLLQDSFKNLTHLID